MTPFEILAEFGQLGVKLEPQVHYRAPKGVMTAELTQKLVQHKSDPLVLLTKREARGTPSTEGSVQISTDEIGTPPNLSASVRPSEAQPVPETELVRYMMDVLAGHPVGHEVRDRRTLAEYVARSIVYRYGPPATRAWCVGQPVTSRKLTTSPWIAKCPEGHLTDEALWHVSTVGWVCEDCEKVYDVRECRLVPRRRAKTDGQSWG